MFMKFDCNLPISIFFFRNLDEKCKMGKMGGMKNGFYVPVTKSYDHFLVEMSLSELPNGSL